MIWIRIKLIRCWWIKISDIVAAWSSHRRDTKVMYLIKESHQTVIVFWLLFSQSLESGENIANVRDVIRLIYSHKIAKWGKLNEIIYFYNQRWRSWSDFWHLYHQYWPPQKYISCFLHYEYDFETFLIVYDFESSSLQVFSIWITEFIWRQEQSMSQFLVCKYSMFYCCYY